MSTARDALRLAASGLLALLLLACVTLPPLALYWLVRGERLQIRSREATSTLQRAEKALQDTSSAAERRGEFEDAYRRLDQELSVLEGILPRFLDRNRTVDHLRASAVDAGLELETVTAGEPRHLDFFSEATIEVVVAGSPSSLIDFLAWLEQERLLMTVSQLELELRENEEVEASLKIKAFAADHSWSAGEPAPQG